MNSKQLWFIIDVGEGNNQCLINKPFQIKLQLQQIRNLNYLFSHQTCNFNIINIAAKMQNYADKNYNAKKGKHWLAV